MSGPETPAPSEVNATTASEPSAGGGSSAGAGSAAGVELNLFARTDVGQVREHNEDNFIVADLTRRARGIQEGSRTATVGKQGHLFAVCDGMGGAAAGEIASQMAVDIIYEKMTDGLADGVAVSRDELARRLVRAVETAGLRIFQEAKADRTRRGMGTTVTAAALVDEMLFLAQVGDSRGYILRDGELVQVTRDQSLVNQLIEAGQLTEEEAETFEHNNIILQALGTADTVQVDLTYASLKPGDVLMLCSDGLSGMVRFDAIRAVLSTVGDPLEACKTLTDKANQAGGHDNITVIVVKFGGATLAEAEGEPLKYRKYALPEEATDQHGALREGDAVDALARRGDPDAPANAASPPARPPSAAPPAYVADDDPIDIPGTHVPTAVVVMLVFGVLAMVAATAMLFLR